MLITDVTSLQESQPFEINNIVQPRVDLTLPELIPPCQKKISSGLFFPNCGCRIFSMNHNNPCQHQNYWERLAVIGVKKHQREIIYSRKSRTNPKEATPLFDQSIYGTVQNPLTKSPICDVQFLLYPLHCTKPIVKTITNPSGGYQITNIPSCAYRITAHKPGYYTFHAVFVLDGDRPSCAIDIPLFPMTAMNYKHKFPKSENGAIV